MSNLKHAAATMGRKGGKKKSKRKAAAAHENGKLGGRPRTLKLRGRTYVDEGAGTYVEKAS
jgi:hypothetical protein